MPASPGIEALLRTIARQLDEVEAEMVRHVEQHYVQSAWLLQSVAGIGRVAIREFYGRLVGAGKLWNAAPIACVRKRVTHLNAITGDHLNAQIHSAVA